MIGKNKKILIMMPAYNEEEIIETVVLDIKKNFVNYDYNILVLNDGSTDYTQQKLECFKADKRLSIINKKNEGHGTTLVRGYLMALKTDCDYILQIDSDDQIPISEFVKLTKQIDNLGLICGYRYERHDPFIRIVITNLLKLIIFIRHWVYIKDSNIPFRLIKKNFLKNNIDKLKNSEVPNILLSILAAKKKDFKQIRTLHKKRNTGTVSIRRFKLLKFCLKSFVEILRFKPN